MSEPTTNLRQIMREYRESWASVIFKLALDGSVEVVARRPPYARPARDHVLVWKEGDEAPRDVNGVAMLAAAKGRT